MAESEHASVAAYIAAHPAPVQALLQTVRAAIQQALPEAEETISYRMPTYKLRGRAVIYFAAWKKHYALYPATVALAEAFADELAPYDVGKGAIRLPYGEPAPVELIGRVAAFLAREAAGKVA